jgi:hypothetical protein
MVEISIDWKTSIEAVKINPGDRQPEIKQISDILLQ